MSVCALVVSSDPFRVRFVPNWERQTYDKNHVRVKIPQHLALDFCSAPDAELADPGELDLGELLSESEEDSETEDMTQESQRRRRRRKQDKSRSTDGESRLLGGLDCFVSVSWVFFFFFFL